ncbi:glycosyltransferase, partial [Streptomyces calidiresistens]
PGVVSLRTAPLWGPPPDPGGPGPGRAGRRLDRRYAEAFAELTGALCAPEDPAAGPRGATGPRRRFTDGLYTLADLSLDHGGLAGWLCSETALRVLEAACRAPAAPRAVRAARVADLLVATERLERALRPLGPDWYRAAPGSREDPEHHRARGLLGVDLCHAVGGGPAALPGLVAHHRRGTPLLVTEYGVRLREHYLDSAAEAARARRRPDEARTVAPGAAGAPVRALLAAFGLHLARETYARAELVVPGNAHARRWQARCGAESGRTRLVYPGLDARPFEAPGEAPAPGTGSSVRGAGGARGVDPAADSLVWVGRVEPSRDLVGLLHAFDAVHRARPTARLHLVADTGRGPTDPRYAAHCRDLAARLFPATDAGPAPVVLHSIGDPGVPGPAAAWALGSVAVLSSAAEGFPIPLIEAMFCARATVSTDVGAVREVIGGTGPVVPPGRPDALAAACLELLADPERRARLGAAARARALELFTVERNLAAFRSMYLEMAARVAARRAAGTGDGTSPVPDDPSGAVDPVAPFSRTPEEHLAAIAPPRDTAADPVGDRPADRADEPPVAPAPVGAAVSPVGGGPA